MITKGEFGIDLYESLFTIGQILGVQNKARQAAEQGKPYEVTAAMKEEQVLRKQLHGQMDRLSDADAATIVRHHPWVMQ